MVQGKRRNAGRRHERGARQPGHQLACARVLLPVCDTRNRFTQRSLWIGRQRRWREFRHHHSGICRSGSNPAHGKRGCAEHIYHPARGCLASADHSRDLRADERWRRRIADRNIQREVGAPWETQQDLEESDHSPPPPRRGRCLPLTVRAWSSTKPSPRRGLLLLAMSSAEPLPGRGRLPPLTSRPTAPVPRNPERTVALRKLLESKDAAVRAALSK
jgi:hypothetical protein